MKEWIKRTFPALRAGWRRLSRFRWIAKYRVVRYSGAPLLKLSSIRYLLWDPEVESHTYEIENVEEMIGFCARAFQLPEGDVRRYMAEAQVEPEFTSLLRARTRWAFDVKTQPPLAQRLLWWVLVRGRKPAVIVETGVYDGLGSLVLLVAAQRNEQEGGPRTRVIGIDSDPRAGRLVPPNLRERWEFVVGYTSDVLEGAVADAKIGVLIHDTPHTEEIQQFEFGLALRHADDPLTIVDGSGGKVPTLAEMAAGRGVEVFHATPVAEDHPGLKGVDFATFPAAAED